MLSVFPLVSAHALTLGEIKTTSYLNEPLNFSIPVDIGRAEDVSFESLRVALASSDEYARQGLVYPWGVGTIRLTLTQDSKGRVYVTGRSTKPVKDLIVYLLIKLNWPNGSLQKEYSTLVDLRGVSDEPSIIKRTPRTVSQSASVATPKLVRSPARVQSSVPTSHLVSHPKKVVHFPGFQSTKEYVDYTVKRGDALSLIAQRLRGDVKLPLHHYIAAITDANKELSLGALSDLSVGQVIRIPNPNLVAKQQHSNQRRLEQASNGAPSQYRVKYGDSLFLIAKAFKPADMGVDAYIQALRQENPSQTNRSNFLEPGIVLTIPNPSEAAVQMASAPEAKLDSVPQSLPTDNELMQDAQLEQTADIKPLALDEQPTQEPEQILPISSLQALEQTEQKPLMSEPEQMALPMDDGVMGLPVDGQQQAVLSEAIENNEALQKEIELLRNNVRNLESSMTTLKRENQNLTANIVNFNEQQQKTPKNTNFLLWGLCAFLGLLSVLCVFLFGRMRRLANAVANMASGTAPAEPNGVSVDNPAYAPEETEDSKGFVGMFKRKPEETLSDSDERDYSDYDFAKSNYDYSQLYDIDKLKEEIKSTGSDAFVQSSEIGVIEIADAEEDLGTVKEFIDSGHYDAAERLLQELISKNPTDIENHLLRLELEVKRGTDDSTNQMVSELLDLFPAEPDQNRIKSQLVTSRLEMVEKNREDQQDDVEVFDIATETSTTLTADVSSVYDVTESDDLSVDSLDEMLLAQEVVDQGKESNADELYEVKVYMSYGHDDMARTSLDEYINQFPNDVDALILRLELLAREQSVTAARTLADKLREERDLSQTQIEKIDEILKKMKEGDFTNSLGDALKSTALMDDDRTQFERTEFIEDQATSLLQDDHELSLDEMLSHIQDEEKDDKHT